MADNSGFYEKLNTLVDSLIGRSLEKAPVTKKPKGKPSKERDKVSPRTSIAPDDSSLKVSPGTSKYIAPDDSSLKTTGAEGVWQDITPAQISKHIKNLQIGLKGTEPEVHDYLKILTYLLIRNYDGATVRITSALRTGSKQAEVMIGNWKKAGGATPISEKNPALERVKKGPDKGKHIRRTEPYLYAGQGPLIETLGDADTTNIYGKSLGYKFSKSLEKGNIEGKEPLEYWSEWWDNTYSKHREQGKHSHGSGKALDFGVSELLPNLFYDSKNFADIKILDETKRRSGPHWHIEVKGIKDFKPPSVANRHFPLIKKAFSISIEPYNYLVQKTLMEMQSKMGSDYFRYQDENGQWVTIDKIVLESGNPGHYGMVRSNNPSTIYLSMDRIKREIEQAANPEEAEDAISKAIIEVVSHEKGHLADHFKPGEHAAEQESKRIEPLFTTLMELGLVKEARRIRSLAYVDPSLNPDDVAQSLLRIIYHFVQKVDPQKQSGYIDNLRNKLYAIDLMQVSSKKKNPGAGVGGTVSITKNILGGHPPDFVSAVLQNLIRGLSKL